VTDSDDVPGRELGWSAAEESGDEPDAGPSRRHDPVAQGGPEASRQPSADAGPTSEAGWSQPFSAWANRVAPEPLPRPQPDGEPQFGEPDDARGSFREPPQFGPPNPSRPSAPSGPQAGWQEPPAPRPPAQSPQGYPPAGGRPAQSWGGGPGPAGAPVGVLRRSDPGRSVGADPQAATGSRGGEKMLYDATFDW